MLKTVAWKLNSIEGLWVDVCSVANRFFGESVTVAGLLSGQDILTALQAVDTNGVQILIPEVTLRAAERDFLDGMTFACLQQALPQATVIATPTEGQALITYTLGGEV